MADSTIDRRIVWVRLGLILLMGALTARLFYLQIIRHQFLTQLALRQQQRTLAVSPPRGKIYDCQGRPLALNRDCASFFAAPADVRNPGRTAQLLAPLVQVPAAQLEKRFRSDRDFVWIRRKLPDAAATAVRRLGLPGIHETRETQRVYPEGRLACHVLGFVGVDNQGLAGVELQCERSIRGTQGWMRIACDAQGRMLASASQICKQPEPGRDVILTIDKVVQHIAERELARAVEKYHARAGSVVVLDPRTGDVLALANLPDFDPNRFNAFPAENRRNRAVQDMAEPGSTFKLVTAAAALETGCFSENDVIDCEQGRAVFQKRTVRDHVPRGRISFRDVIGFSSNIGAVKIGLKTGAECLVRYAEAFGFGRPSGIELPGEAGGLVKRADKWDQTTRTSFPYGQEVAVTTLQTALAYAAVANDGWLPNPHIVRQPAGENPGRPNERPLLRKQAVSAETARRLRGLLTAVVQQGTGTEAGLPNYTVAGKTGTAQKPLPHARGYDPVNHIASFVGFMPAEQPQVLIAVVIDSPRGVEWGGVVAGPVFREITQNLVAYLGIPPAGQGAVSVKPPVPAGPERAAAAPACLVRVPGVCGQEPGAGVQELAAAGLRADCQGRGGLIASQQPAAGLLVTAGSTVLLGLDNGGTGGQVRVPNLSGQPLRPALQVLAAYGLRARVNGSGVVCSQYPIPNSRAQGGAVCILSCKDPEVMP